MKLSVIGKVREVLHIGYFSGLGSLMGNTVAVGTGRSKGRIASGKDTLGSYILRGIK
jgi:hypothetical protein